MENQRCLRNSNTIVRHIFIIKMERKMAPNHFRDLSFLAEPKKHPFVFHSITPRWPYIMIL